MNIQPRASTASGGRACGLGDDVSLSPLHSHLLFLTQVFVQMRFFTLATIWSLVESLHCSYQLPFTCSEFSSCWEGMREVLLCVFKCKTDISWFSLRDTDLANEAALWAGPQQALWEIALSSWALTVEKQLDLGW